jgi:hypothetical protein
VLRPCQHEKLARGTQDTEHAMNQKLTSAIAVIGIDIGKNSFHIRDSEPYRFSGFDPNSDTQRNVAN